MEGSPVARVSVAAHGPASPIAAGAAGPASPGGAFAGLNALAPLLSGALLRKFGRRGSPGVRAVRLSADALRVEWASRGKALEESSVRVDDMVGLLHGQGTPNFVRFAGSTTAGDKQLSFSILYRSTGDAGRHVPAEQRDAELLALRAGGYVAPGGGLRKGIRTLDLQAADAQQCGQWVKGLRLLIREHQMRVEAKHEERQALRREGMPNPQAQPQQQAQAQPYAPPPHIPQPYAPPQQARPQEGEAGPGEEAVVYGMQPAQPYCPPAAFSPSASSAASYSLSPQSPHSPVLFGSPDPPVSPRGVSHAAAVGAGAGVAAASSPSAAGAAAAAVPPVSPVAEPYLPSIAATLVEMREVGCEFRDAELEGDCSARVYMLTADQTALVCMGRPSPDEDGDDDQAEQQRIPISSIRNLQLDDSAASYSVANGGAYEGFLRFAFRDDTGSACGRMHHLSLASSNRFVLFLFHKGLRHLVERANRDPSPPEPQPQPQLQPQPEAPRAQEQPASPRHQEQAQHDLQLAAHAAQHQLPLSPLAVPPLSPRRADGQRDAAPFVQAHAPQPAPAQMGNVLPASPLAFPLPLQPAASPVVPPVILAPPSPPPPAVPEDLASMIRHACRSELQGLPDWQLNLAIVAKVAPQTKAQNEQLLSKQGVLSGLLRGPDHGSGLLALILFELLFENCNSVHYLPTITHDAAWMSAHFVKVLPRWSRKPLEGDGGGLRGLFAKPNPRAQELLKASEQTKLALLRWNKIKVIISSLANKREQGRHWYAAYEKLRNARAYDHPNAFAPKGQAAVQAQNQNQSPKQQGALASPRAVHAGEAAPPRPAAAVGASPASVSPRSLPDLLAHDPAHFARSLGQMSSALSSLVDLLAAALDPHAHAFDANSPQVLRAQLQQTGDACEAHLQSLRAALTLVSSGGHSVPKWMTDEHTAQIVNQLDLLQDTVHIYQGLQKQEQQEQQYHQQPQQHHAFNPHSPMVPQPYSNRRSIAGVEEFKDEYVHADADEEEVKHAPPPSIPARPLRVPAYRPAEMAGQLSPSMHFEAHHRAAPAAQWAPAPSVLATPPPGQQQQQQLQQQQEWEQAASPIVPSEPEPVHDAAPAAAVDALDEFAEPPAEIAPDAPSVAAPVLGAHPSAFSAVDFDVPVDAPLAIFSPSSSDPPLSPLAAASSPIADDASLASSRYSRFEPPSASALSAAVDSYAADFFAQPLDDNFLAEAPINQPAPAAAPAAAPVAVAPVAVTTPPLSDPPTHAAQAVAADGPSAIPAADPVAPLQADASPPGGCPSASVDSAPLSPLPSPRGRAPAIPPRPRIKSPITPRAAVLC